MVIYNLSKKLLGQLRAGLINYTHVKGVLITLRSRYLHSPFNLGGINVRRKNVPFSTRYPKTETRCVYDHELMLAPMVRNFALEPPEPQTKQKHVHNRNIDITKQG